ncbi:MAG TPA: hypothetical protein VIR79_03430 [Nitrospira sp.]
MRILGLCAVLILPTAMSWAQSEKAEPSKAEKAIEEPTFQDHYENLRHMQERMSQLSLDEQARFQPRMERAEREACRQLNKEKQERRSGRDYRREGGYQLEAFALDFDRYCERFR